MSMIEPVTHNSKLFFSLWLIDQWPYSLSIFPMKIVESENSSAQAIKQVESRVANLEENVNEIKSLLTNIQALLEKDK